MLLNAIELNDLAFNEAVSWENDDVEVAVTNYGNDAILIVIEVQEIQVLIFENNYKKWKKY